MRIRGDLNDPVSKGFICPKGSTLKQLHDDPDRLRQPVIKDRSGPTPQWREASWDEAFAHIDAKLQPLIDAHGRQSLGVVLGNPTVHNLGGLIMGGEVVKAAGTTNFFSASTVDQMPKHLSSGLMWGSPQMFPLPDIERTDYLLMLGANPYVSNGSLVTIPDWPGKLDALVDRGGRFVVVDPVRTRTAQSASEHLSIIPGTDAWWVMALIHTLFDEDLVEIGRLEPHVSGVDDLRQAVAGLSPESVADRVGIDAETTRRIARELAAAPKAIVYGRIGTNTVAFGTLTSWAIDALNVLTGNLDRPGGVMFSAAPAGKPDQKPGGRGFKTGRWASRVSNRPEVMAEFPAAVLAEEIKTDGPGQIKALFLVASNPVRSFPNSERLNTAFQTLDLLVAVDPYINASSRHADVILPPRSALERSHYDFAFESNMVRSFAKYSPPVFHTDAPDEPEILARLALVLSGAGPEADAEAALMQNLTKQVQREISRKGSLITDRSVEEILGELEPWTGIEKVIDLRLRTGRHGDGFGANPNGLTLAKLVTEHPHGQDFGPLVERMPAAIATKSAKVELWCDTVAGEFDRLAAESEPVDGLVLVGRRHLRSCNTWMHNVEVLVRGKERCTLLVHPDDAAEHGLADGDRAQVASRVGAVEAPVEITADIARGVVSLPFGWGYDEEGIEMSVARQHPGTNSNRLTDDSIVDVPSGTGVLNGIPVSIRALAAV